MLATAACTPADEPATGPVAVPAPSSPLAPAALRACTALLAALPAEIDPGVRRRPVEGDAGRSAAWGDPPVVLACGVAAPDRRDLPAQVEGVLWSVRDIGAGFRWTTAEFGVHVAVDIPQEYENGAELVVPLGAPLRASLPRPASPAPAG